MRRELLLLVFLWWAVIGMALWVGGTVYQMTVVVPIWSASLPESLRSFILGTPYSRTIWNFFGPPWMALRIVPVVGAAIVGWPYVPQRYYLLWVVVCIAIIMVVTLAYVYPINAVIYTPAVANAQPERVTQLATRWILVDRLRFVVGLIAFLLLLQVFRMPVSK